jgi:hypothetical protein
VRSTVAVAYKPHFGSLQRADAKRPRSVKLLTERVRHTVTFQLRLTLLGS